jgi:hypothetical protein
MSSFVAVRHDFVRHDFQSLAHAFVA